MQSSEAGWGGSLPSEGPDDSHSVVLLPGVAGAAEAGVLALDEQVAERPSSRAEQHWVSGPLPTLASAPAVGNEHVSDADRPGLVDVSGATATAAPASTDPTVPQLEVSGAAEPPSDDLPPDETEVPPTLTTVIPVSSSATAATRPAVDLDKSDAAPVLAPPGPTGRDDAAPAAVVPTQGKHAKPDAAGSGPRRGKPSLGTASLTSLALLLLAFLANVTLVGTVEHARSQRIAYADLRRALSDVTAPLGPVSGTTLLAAGTPIAYLSSPRLALTREVVLEGTSSSVLRGGPGHLRSSAFPGQPGTVVLFGRASTYGSPFGKAAELKRGDIITLTSGQGAHTYQVTGSRTGARPPVTSAVGRLVLVTSEGTLPYTAERARYVDAELTSPLVPAPARPTVTLSSAEGPLRGDPAAWPAIALLMQVLAAAALATTWASRRFGSRQAWLVGCPVLVLFAVLGSREIVRLLPNVL